MIRRRGLILSSICAMARPRRPDAERLAVIAAAGEAGPATTRARRVARAVAVAAMADVDRHPVDKVIGLLRKLDPTPVDTLATDSEIDTAGLILSERVQRIKDRGGRRLLAQEIAREDADVLAAVTARLAARYRRYLHE